MPGSPDQNGVAERRNRTLMDMVRVWGCPSEVRIYNPQEKKLDPRTISGYFIGYAERSKGSRFIVHLTALGLWNQEMRNFLRMT